MAPGRSSAADEGREQRAVGRAEHRLAHADQEHDARRGMPSTGSRRARRTPGRATGAPWSSDTVTSSRRRSKASASIPPTSEKSSSGPSWAKSSTPTNVGRLEQVVGERAEDHVLHPAADVRQERADEHPPEHACAGAPPGPSRSGTCGRRPPARRRRLRRSGRATVVGRARRAWPSQDAIRDAKRASPYRDPPMAVEFEELELPFDDPADVRPTLRRDPRPAGHVPVLPALRRRAHARARPLPLRLRLARLLLRLTVTLRDAVGDPGLDGPGHELHGDGRDEQAHHLGQQLDAVVAQHARERRRRSASTGRSR